MLSKNMRTLAIVTTLAIGILGNAKGSELTDVINESYADESVKAYEYNTTNIKMNSIKCAFMKGELELETVKHGAIVNGKYSVVTSKALTLGTIVKINNCLGL